MILSSYMSDIVYLYVILIIKRNRQLFIGNFVLHIILFSWKLYKIMERKNRRKLGYVKLSLYETRTGCRRRRRARTIFTESQLENLENQFQINHYADPFILEMMSIKLNLDIDPIKVWFKNRRRRETKAIKQEICLSSINQRINQSNKKRPSMNESIGMKRSIQQNDVHRNIIKNEENFNSIEIDKMNNSSYMEYGSSATYSDNNNNKQNNINESMKNIMPIYVEHDLYALYKNGNNYKKVAKAIASLYSEYSSPFLNSNPCTGGFFSKYFSSSNLQELACLLN